MPSSEESRCYAPIGKSCDLIRASHRETGHVLLLEGGRATPKVAATANALCSIARYLDLPFEQLTELSRLARKLRSRPNGMTPKNKKRLAPLQDASTKRKLIQLPLKIARDMEKITKPTHTQAIRMRFAVAVATLQFAPMRVSNLASLERYRLSPHFQNVRYPRNSRLG